MARNLHPLALAVWLCALLTILVARTMSVPNPVVLGFHLPVFLLLSAVAAYLIPDRVRTIVFLVCVPTAALTLATFLI